jgi:sterol desaturase/sphingolipid hydroxylase (fatty acid hydroxylase superfamily)
MLTSVAFNYKHVFPSEWYDEYPVNHNPFSKSEGVVPEWPKPLGLSLGISAVIVGHAFLLLYFMLRREGVLGSIKSVQKEGARKYQLAEALVTHLAQPEGFVMLGAYLTGTWMLGLMPSTYYAFTGGINWLHVFAQLLLQDFFQYCMHQLEHRLSPELYKKSHKPHHRFTNPRLFDAFDGSPTDTFLMILVPLYLTALCVPANVWSYMAFGSLYANWLVLIHAEYPHVWDGVFRRIGFGTAADHHVHHKLFKYNFGHTFMYWDRIFGTYRDPADVSLFNKGI